ncbi:MAG: OmpA family protein, partial [Spirochaetota bacterium]
NAALRSELDVKNKEVADLQNSNALKNLEIDELNKQIDMKNNELQRLYDGTQMLEKNLKGLGDILKSSGGELSNQMALLMQGKQTLEDQVIALRGDIDAAFNRNERLNQLVGEYQKQIGDQAADIKSLQKERDSLQKTSNNLKNALEGKTDELSRQVANLTTQKQKLEQQVSELRKNIDSQLAKEAAEKDRMKKTYDQLVKSLESEIGQKTVDIQHFKDALTINIMDKIFFDSGKAEIKPEGYSVLRRVGAILKAVPDKVIRIEGHTDDIPIGPKIAEKYPTNWELGAARAANVAEFLRKEVGIDPKRISVASYSMYRPLVPHTTNENRAKNRRIEIVVLDKLHYQMMEVKESMEQ